jgi:hypothetical protein
MKIRTWTPDMSLEDTKDLAYWERNMLALYYADGWYNDDVESDECPPDHNRELDTNACPSCEREAPRKPRFDGWRRVLSLAGGTITFHIPDNFDVGNLDQIMPNWDGHTTEEKWKRMARGCGVKVDD